MPAQARRRSPRLAAKAKADADASTAEKEARKPDVKATRRASRSSLESLPGDEGREKTRAAEGVRGDENAKPLRKRASTSRAKGRCSLQSLEQTPRRSPRIKAQAGDKASCQAPKTTKSGTSPPDNQNHTSATMMMGRRLTPFPVTESKPGPETAAVNPKRAKFDLGQNSLAEYDEESPPSVVELLTPKGVKFDLGRNSFAEYEKENPPNVIQLLTRRINIAVSPASEDLKTSRNEEILAEWDSVFGDCLDRNKADGAGVYCNDYYMNVIHRKRSTRITIFPRRMSMSSMLP